MTARRRRPRLPRERTPDIRPVGRPRRTAACRKQRPSPASGWSSSLPRTISPRTMCAHSRRVSRTSASVLLLRRRESGPCVRKQDGGSWAAARSDEGSASSAHALAQSGDSCSSDDANVRASAGRLSLCAHHACESHQDCALPATRAPESQARALSRAAPLWRCRCPPRSPATASGSGAHGTSRTAEGQRKRSRATATSAAPRPRPAGPCARRPHDPRSVALQ